MTVSRGIRRRSTAREISLIKRLAKEGLSVARTHYALAELYNIHMSLGQLRGYIQYNKIRFAAESGAPRKDFCIRGHSMIDAYLVRNAARKNPDKKVRRCRQCQRFYRERKRNEVNNRR